MSQPVNYAQVYADIISESGTGREVFPKGRYKVKLAKVSPGTSKGGKLSVGLMWVCIDAASPFNTKSTWTNLYLTPQDQNATAFSIYIKGILSLGIPQSVLKGNVPPEELHNHIPVGITGFVALDTHIFNDEAQQDFKGFTPDSALAAAAAPSKPASAPVAVAVPVAVPVPAAAAAPAVDEVAALKAKLAALESSAPAPAGDEPF